MNKLKKLIQSMMIGVFVCAWTPSAQACTGIELKSQDGHFISGRTLEFGIPIHTVIMVIPRHYSFTGTLPDGSDGLEYTSRYAVVGGSLDGGVEVQDGLNEAGLMVGAFYFPGYASYTSPSPGNRAQALSPIQFPTWLLTQFSSVDEVKAALAKVSIVPTVYEAWGIVPPLHYVVYDNTGKSIVIEPLNGSLVVSDNPLGVFTNSPTFDWHMTNLRNYINLSPINAAPRVVNGTTLAQMSQGSGLHGLPGDFSSPSRFVRAAVFTVTALPAANSQQSVFQAFHILNQFDIPMGAVRDVQNGKVTPEYTMFTAVKDPQNLDYYYRTYNDQDISVVHLRDFDFNAKKIKRMNTNVVQAVADRSDSLR